MGLFSTYWQGLRVRSMVPVFDKRLILGVNFAPPLSYTKISSGWGRPRGYRKGIHRGVDIYAPKRTPFYSTTDGTVLRVDKKDDSFAGKHIIVRTVTPYGDINVRYLHMHSIDVKRGEQVFAGQTILGTVGRTGTKHSGAHIHYDILVDKNWLAAYKAAFGKPKGGFPKRKAYGTQVPVEALLPVHAYTKRTVRDAIKNRVAMRSRQADIVV